MKNMKYTIIILTIHRNIHRISNARKFMNMQGLKETIDYNFFYGIDFKNEKKNKLKNICKKGFKNICPYSTLACASSHILLWNYISQLNYDYVIILEDDTFINIETFNIHKN